MPTLLRFVSPFVLGVVVMSASMMVMGCHHDRFPPGFNPDKKSGPDGKRSGAQLLLLNHSHTDEVSYANQDRTDWYVVTLRGQPGVLANEIHWDNAKSDLMIDVFDEFGKQMSASPTRAPGSTQKTLLTQIDHPSVFYIRISAPKPDDGTVYTMEAKWDSPPERVVVVTEPVPAPHDPPPHPKHHVERDPEPKEKPPSETIQGHIVSAYRESGQMTYQIDKGTAAGVRVGMSGTVLAGASGEDPLPGATFRITQIVSDRASLGRGALLTLGKNTRVAITVR